MAGALDHLSALPHPPQQVWRLRGLDDKELLETRDSAPRLVRLRSSLVDPATDERHIVFMNYTGHLCQTIWLNHEGHEVAYAATHSMPAIFISRASQQTYVGHPWIVQDVATKLRLCLRQMQLAPQTENWKKVPEAWIAEPDANANQQVVFASVDRAVTYEDIHDPPPVRWATATHKVYPADFKQSVLVLLLCHRHARGVDTMGRLGLADLPQHLVVEIVERMAPMVWQSADCQHWEGRQDLGAVRMPAAYWDRVTF